MPSLAALGVASGDAGAGVLPPAGRLSNSSSKLYS